MPLYEYKCRECGYWREDIRLVAERHDAPKCDRCKAAMQLILSAVRGIVKDPAAPK